MSARDPNEPNRYGGRCAKRGHRWRKPPKGNPAWGIGGYMKTRILMICDRCGEPCLSGYHPTLPSVVPG